jgi:hypothetical protein
VQDPLEDVDICLYRLWVEEVVCAEGYAGSEVGGELFIEDGGDFGEVFDDDLEVGESGCEDGVVVTG